ncbi:E3 ubiquitin-protein ligase Zswim2 [Chytriomyces hyalinus]|nr:E3 ubiquitin-protein ligase Zswim2 [Chytriomyces hyalinus]
MSREELLNELLVLEEEDTASRLRYAARKREVIEKLRACGKRDVLGVGLDVALVPAAVSKSGISDDGSNDYNLDVGRVLVDGAKQLVFKNDSDDCQKDEQLEILIRTESEKTLSGDDGVMDHDIGMMKTATEVVGKTSVPDSLPSPEHYSLCLHTDPLVIAAEVSWWWTREAAASCSGSAAEPVDTNHDDQATTVCTEVATKEMILKASPAAEQYLYGLYLDALIGPMAVIVKESAADRPDVKEPGATTAKTEKASKNFKVTLGHYQSCNCHTHLMENDLCVHILWVMIKVFRVPLESEMLYQNSLVEREILELMDSRKKKNVPASSDADAETKSNEAPLGKGHVRQRAIEEGDVCPICMEDLDNATGAITYCKMSCGNNIHVKCMKVLMDHQTKSLGLENIKCPLCRKDFGKYEDLKKELSEGFHHQEQRVLNVRKRRSSENATDATVVKSMAALFTSVTSASWQDVTGAVTRSSKWIVSKRDIRPVLSEDQINDLQNRDLSPTDYDTLLSLNAPRERPTAEEVIHQNQPLLSTPLRIISSFPTRTLTYAETLVQKRNNTDGSGTRPSLAATTTQFQMESSKKKICEVCVGAYATGDVTRQIPCGHSFHRQCIDRWLLMQRSGCPTCGRPAFYTPGGVREGVEMAGRMEECTFVAASFNTGDGRSRSVGVKKKKQGSKPSSSKEVDASRSEQNLDLGMMVVGSRSAGIGNSNAEQRTPPTSSSSSSSPSHMRGLEMSPSLSLLNTHHRPPGQQPKPAPPSKLIRLPPLYSQTKLKPQMPAQLHLQKTVSAGKLKWGLDAASSPRASLTQQDSMIFDDLLVSHSLAKLSHHGVAAVAAESGDGMAASKHRVAKGAGLIPGVKTPTDQNVSFMAATGMSLASNFRPPALPKRRYLPHTSLAAIENPSLSLTSLMEIIPSNSKK